MDLQRGVPALATAALKKLYATTPEAKTLRACLKSLRGLCSMGI